MATPAGFLFRYKDRLYRKIVPSKRLFNSTTVHEVVTRGDVFALDMVSYQFTVIPGDAPIFPVEEAPK